MPHKRVKLVVDYAVRDLCFRPYANHPKGCPNYGHKAGCPPHCKTIENIIHLNRVFVVWNIFNLADHVARMKDRHPEWSWRQLTCCLYWQPTARKQLEEEIKKFFCCVRKARLKYAKRIVLRTPEACGVNVTATMKRIGQDLQWPPKTVTYQVAVIGIKK